MDGSAKCGIISSGESIHVAIYRLHLPEKALLDKIEGVGKGYDEHIVDVPRFGKCFTYVASRTHIQDDLVPLDWYKEMVVIGCEWNSFPDSYVDEIRVIPAAVDSDRRRSTEQWNIVEQIRAGAGCQRLPV